MFFFDKTSDIVSPCRRQLVKIILRHGQRQSPFAGTGNIFPKLDFVSRENLHTLAPARNRDIPLVLICRGLDRESENKT
jgi:hypothetical protein